MEDHEVLQRLLDIENDAADLVNGAQAEGDRRISEGEKQNRACHDEIYAGEVRALDASFAADTALTKENYKKQLDAYYESLKTMPLDTKAFFLLAEKLLIVKES